MSEAELAEPPPEQKAGRECPRSTAGRNLLWRLKEHEGATLAFAVVEGVPFTNNQAERDLQKVSGCFRTDQGAAVYVRLQAAISTCRKQGRNVFAAPCDLFARQPLPTCRRPGVTSISE